MDEQFMNKPLQHNLILTQRCLMILCFELYEMSSLVPDYDTSSNSSGDDLESEDR